MCVRAHTHTRHTCRCTITNRPRVTVQTSNVAGTRFPHGITEQMLVPLYRDSTPLSCPVLPLSLYQPQAPLSLEPSTCPANMRTQVFSPSLDPPSSFPCQTRPCLPDLLAPSHLSRPSLPKTTFKVPTASNLGSVQCGSKRRPGSAHETKANFPRLHWGK